MNPGRFCPAALKSTQSSSGGARRHAQQNHNHPLSIWSRGPPFQEGTSCGPAAANHLLVIAGLAPRQLQPGSPAVSSPDPQPIDVGMWTSPRPQSAVVTEERTPQRSSIDSAPDYAAFLLMAPLSSTFADKCPRGEHLYSGTPARSLAG